MKPARQKGMWIEIENRIGGDAERAEPRQQAPAAQRVDHVRAAAHELAADKHLRNGRNIRAGSEGAANASAEVAALILHRIEIDTAEGDSQAREQPARVWGAFPCVMSAGFS